MVLSNKYKTSLIKMFHIILPPLYLIKVSCNNFIYSEIETYSLASSLIAKQYSCFSWLGYCQTFLWSRSLHRRLFHRVMHTRPSGLDKLLNSTVMRLIGSMAKAYLAVVGTFVLGNVQISYDTLEGGLLKPSYGGRGWPNRHILLKWLKNLIYS